MLKFSSPKLNKESKGMEIFVKEYGFFRWYVGIVRGSEADKILSNLSRSDLFIFDIYSASFRSFVFRSYTTPPPSVNKCFL